MLNIKRFLKIDSNSIEQRAKEAAVDIFNINTDNLDDAYLTCLNIRITIPKDDNLLDRLASLRKEYINNIINIKK
jgi:hypothetical protein